MLHIVPKQEFGKDPVEFPWQNNASLLELGGTWEVTLCDPLFDRWAAEDLGRWVSLLWPTWQLTAAQLDSAPAFLSFLLNGIANVFLSTSFFNLTFLVALWRSTDRFLCWPHRAHFGSFSFSLYHTESVLNRCAEDKQLTHDSKSISPEKNRLSGVTFILLTKEKFILFSKDWRKKQKPKTQTENPKGPWLLPFFCRNWNP